MAHSGKTITFATDLLPNEDDVYSLGSNNKKWKIVGNLTGEVNGTAANATKISATLNTTATAYLMGTTSTLSSTAANVSLIGDSGVYLTTTAGQLSAMSYSINYSSAEKVTLQWNDTDKSLDFIFA